MSEQRPPFVDTVLRQHFASVERPLPRLSRAAFEVLLVDDSQRRLRLAERAATAWGRTATVGHIPVAAAEDHLMVTPQGLVYVARLRPRRAPLPPGGVADDASPGAGAGAPAPVGQLYYVATPVTLFDSFVDGLRAITEQLNCIVAVDARFGRELHFPWPLDTGLRRTLGSHEVLVGR